MLIFKHMCVASDNRTIVVAMLLFVENEYEIGIIVRSLGVSGVTRNYLIRIATPNNNLLKVTVYINYS